MERGTVKNMGTTSDIIDQYLTGDNNFERFIKWTDDERPSSTELEIVSVTVLDKDDRPDSLLTTTDEIKVEIEYIVKEEIKDLRVAINVMTPDGMDVFSSSDFGFQVPSRLRTPGNYKSICYIPGSLLNLGKYVVKVDFDIPKTRPIIMDIPVEFTISELIYNQLGFTIAPRPSGTVHPFLHWDVTQA